MANKADMLIELSITEEKNTALPFGGIVTIRFIESPFVTEK